MKNKKKLLTVLACALVAALLVGGTIAWLTDADTKTNKIKIATIGTTPDEPNWPGDPDDPNDPPVTVYPGVPQAKDPTITVDAGSEAAYARVLVKIHTDLLDVLDDSATTFPALAGGTITGAALPMCNAPWTEYNADNRETSGNYTILEYRYPTAEEGGETGKSLGTVFSGFQIAEGTTADDLDGVDMDIIVVSQAIQAAGHADANAAFAELGNVADAF